MADTLKSAAVPAVHAMAVVNPDGTSIGAGGGGGGLTDEELRATPVPVSVSGVSTADKQDTGNTSLATLAGAVDTGKVQVDVVTVPTTNVTQSGSWSVDLGTIGDVATQTTLAAIDTSTSSKYITGINHGVKTVTTAGTDVALATSTSCKKVTIQAQTDNTNIIAVGGSGVDATIATGTGIVLYPGDVFELDIDNLSDVYIDSIVSGEGVRFTYFT